MQHAVHINRPDLFNFQKSGVVVAIPRPQNSFVNPIRNPGFHNKFCYAVCDYSTHLLLRSVYLYGQCLNKVSLYTPFNVSSFIVQSLDVNAAK